MIRIEGLHKTFGHNHVLRGVDLHVPPRSLYGLIGPGASPAKNQFGRRISFELPTWSAPHCQILFCRDRPPPFREGTQISCNKTLCTELVSWIELRRLILAVDNRRSGAILQSQVSPSGTCDVPAETAK
jgi:hypothetical protein